MPTKGDTASAPSIYNAINRKNGDPTDCDPYALYQKPCFEIMTAASLTVKGMEKSLRLIYVLPFVRLYRFLLDSSSKCLN